MHSVCGRFWSKGEPDVASRYISRSAVIILLTAVLLALVPNISVRAQAPRADISWLVESTINDTSTVYGATFIDANTGWAVGSGGGLFVTHDGGQTWSTKVTGISNDLKWIVFPDAQDGYAAGDSVILHTTDGGNTWQQINLPTTTNHISSISAPTATTVYVTANPDSGPNGVYESTNSGQTWGSSPILASDNFSTVLFPSSADGWAIGNGAISRTVDGGATWKTVANDGRNYTNIDFVSSSVGYIAGGSDPSQSLTFIMSTSDGGATWTPTGSSPQLFGDCSISECPTSMAFLSQSQGLVGLTDPTDPSAPIYNTGDSGTTWQLMPSSIDFYPDRIIVGYRGSIPFAITKRVTGQSS